MIKKKPLPLRQTLVGCVSIEAVVQRKFRLAAIRREMDLGRWVDSKELHGG